MAGVKSGVGAAATNAGWSAQSAMQMNGRAFMGMGGRTTGGDSIDSLCSQQGGRNRGRAFQWSPHVHHRVNDLASYPNPRRYRPAMLTMKEIFLTIAAMLLTPTLVLHAADAFLVKDGQPQAEIVIAENPQRAVRFAAQDLRTYVEKISGARLPI